MTARAVAIMAPEEADAYSGEVIAHWELGRGSWIERADPRIKVAAKFLTDALSGDIDTVTVDMTRLTLRAEADGQTFIYRVVGFCPEQQVYLAEWPD